MWYPLSSVTSLLSQVHGAWWAHSPDFKYVGLRVDTRDSKVFLTDREGKAITLEELETAVAEAKKADEYWAEEPFVWSCAEDDDGLCGEVWAQYGVPDYCPECSFVLYHNAINQGKDPYPVIKRPKSLGYTLSEVREAESRFGCDIDVYVPTPIPLGLVQLSILPRETWVGRGIFHPQAQMGERANWHRYEIGVVIAIEQDPDFEEDERCRFIAGTFHSQSTALAYRPDNLWTPA